VGPAGVIYLDSWVWLEFGLHGSHEASARDVVDRARERGGAFSAIGLTEVEYVLERELDRESADLLSSAIEDMDGIQVVPVTVEVARRAASIRTKYYQRRARELSYADAIHVATAALLDCSEVHTGDADFEEIDEIEPVLHPT